MVQPYRGKREKRRERGREVVRPREREKKEREKEKREKQEREEEKRRGELHHSAKGQKR